MNEKTAPASSRSEMLSFIREELTNADHVVKKEIAVYLYMANVSMKDSAAGCVVRYDSLNDSLVEHVYTTLIDARKN